MIVWQTARTAQRARPGQRVPTRRASGLPELTIEVDTRERYPYKFAGRPVEVQRVALPAGDYAIRYDDRILRRPFPLGTAARGRYARLWSA